MTIHHGGAGHPGEDRGFDSYIEDARGMDIGPDNDQAQTVQILQLLSGEQRQMATSVTSCLKARQT